MQNSVLQLTELIVTNSKYLLCKVQKVDQWAIMKVSAGRIGHLPEFDYGQPDEHECQLIVDTADMTRANLNISSLS